MSQETLQQFARQLHAWSTDELQRNPRPFRSVDVLPTLLGETDNIKPPVVFWINRESHLAAGVILLPRKDPADVLESGAEICAALGLDTYYTWGISEVAAWRIDSTPSRQWTEPLPKTSMQEASAFKDVLSLLLNNMQNRFFSNHQQQPRLSASYLTNMLYRSIEMALPPAIASTTSTATSPSKNEEDLRREITCVTMQILALYSQNVLPTRSTPDTLRNDLNRASAHFPGTLSAVLTPDKRSSQLAGPVSVKLHHLFQRLQQIGPALTPFIPEALARLLHFWAKTGRLQPLPTTLKKNRPTLIINPDRYHPETSVTVEVAQPPLTAATALLRLLQSLDRPHPAQYPNLLSLTSPVTVDTVIGTLSDRNKATATEQKQMNALLRHSWPNRHLKLAATTPRWAYELIHLGGLLRDSPDGTLDLPADWLWAPYGEQLFSLLTERLILSRITPTNNEQVRLEFNQKAANQQIIIRSIDGDVRTLDNQNKEITRTDILLALSLTIPLFDLVRNGELCTTTDDIQDLEAIEIFLHSSLGRGLWQIISPKKQQPKKDKLIAEVIRTRLPLPSVKTLAALSKLKQKKTPFDTTAIDRELEVWLGAACLTEPHPVFRSTTTVTTVENNPAEGIAKKLLQTGEILSFPRDYLYDIPVNARQTFLIAGPLRIGEIFFNSVTLLPQSGSAIEVEGAITARTLQLISTFQIGEIELPKDEQQVGLLLDRYLRDLKTLYIRLLNESAQPEHIATTNLADQIWKHLPVPPREDLNDN